MPTFSVILAAAGSSTRFADPHYKKPFAMLNRKAVWLYSAELFLKRQDVKQIIMVIAPEDKDDFLSKFGPNLAVLGIDVVLGGRERSDSVENALAKVDDAADYVVIHDAARPCLDADLIERVFLAAGKSGAAIPAIPVNSTVKKSSDGQRVDSTVDRKGLFLAQTPQVFRRTLICDLYKKRNGTAVTDESQLAEINGVEVSLVEGSPLNIKITTKQDLAFASACLAAQPVTQFDAPIHPFHDDRLIR